MDMPYFTEEERLQIKHAIEAAEAQTSGEICVCLEKYCDTDPVTKALDYFQKLNLSKTRMRNGVLLYIATLDKVFAIIGDEGIHQKVGQSFWDDTKELLKSNFQQGLMVKGIIKCIEKAAFELKSEFPKMDDDKNELSDDIIIGDA